MSTRSDKARTAPIMSLMSETVMTRSVPSFWGDRGQLIGFRNAAFVLYPVGRHALLMGTLEGTAQPVENFNYFASLNTMMLQGADAQVYSHIPDFSWLDEHPLAVATCPRWRRSRMHSHTHAVPACVQPHAWARRLLTTGWALSFGSPNDLEGPPCS